jgi:thiol-disulfide isomerase/thioredoxin
MKRRELISVIVLLGVALLFIYSIKSGVDEQKEIVSEHIDIMDVDQKSEMYLKAIEIVNPSGFVNTDNINISSLIGKKVILVDFWTYSCINCIRTQPYLNSWYEKYSENGLEIIGIHTPEFDFEKDINNVQNAVNEADIKYPVVLDNDYATWRAYQNRYWPRKYLIDIDGYIVYDHIGEGGYDETEMKIRDLLNERAQKLGEAGLELLDEKTDAEEVEFSKIGTPETYLGSSRNSAFGNGVSGMNLIQNFSAPSNIVKNKYYLGGDWEITSEYIENNSAGAKIVLKYFAKKVFLVASAENGPIRAKILVDGKDAGDLAGSDVDDGIYVTFHEDRLYRLVDDLSGYKEHTIEIIMEGPGVKAFAFTFG